MRTVKNRILLTFLVLAGIVLSCESPGDEMSRRQLFDLNWKFYPGNHSFATETDLDDSAWRSLDLPHNWRYDKGLVSPVSETFGSDIPTEAWYRKHFEIPDNWAGKSIWIEFEEIGGDTEIFLNGFCIGEQKKQAGTFQLHLDPHLDYKGKNVIAIHVNSQFNSEGFFEADSGISRHAWLLVKERKEKKK